MYFYIALIIVGLLIIWRCTTGFKRGMVKEIISLIAMVVAGFCAILILGVISSYLHREIGEMIQMIIILLVVCAVYRLVSLLLTSVKLISGLPVIRWLDKILGIVIGAAEGLVISGFFVYILKSWGLSILA